MITLTNDFHSTEITLRKKAGDSVSRSTYYRVRRALCGISDCTCSHSDGTRGSRYELMVMGYDPDAPITVLDHQPEREN